MAAEPITIFARRGDPAGVLATLRQLTPNVTVTGPEGDWTRAHVLLTQGLFRRHPRTVTFVRHRDRAAAAVSTSDRSDPVLRLTAAFRVAIDVRFSPDERTDPPDERLEIVTAVVRHLDGALFRPSGLYDAAGRAILRADGTVDTAAVLPAAAEGPIDDDPSPAAPSVERVARRALVLAAVGARALLEREGPSADATRDRILRWIDDTAIGDELEQDEGQLIRTPAGQLPPRDAVAGWRLEGLGVLAWAMNRFALPPHDQLCDPGAVLAAVGFLDAGRAAAVPASPLRPPAELAVARDQLSAIDWRLRQFAGRPKAIDFRRLAVEAAAGPLDLAGVRLLDGDLALGDAAIAAAPKDRVQLATSAARERHLAACWLGGGGVYSRTDTTT